MSEVKFVVVEFPDENDSLFVVPESWIVPSNDDGQSVCLWPKDGDTGTITKSAKAAKPPEAGWLSFRANVKYRSRSYKKAMDKLKRYQFESDIEASSSDCSRLLRSPLSINDSHITASPIPRVVSNSNDGMSAKISKLEATVENCVKEIHNLKELVTSQNQLLQQLLPNATYEEFSPITTLEELDKVEADLKEMTYFSKMVQMIGILGGRDMPDATRRILSKLISFDLSLQLTWVGSATKKAMRNYKQVIQLISVALRQNRAYSAEPQSSVEEVIKCWLRYASDRNGGRIHRLKRTVFNDKNVN